MMQQNLFNNFYLMSDQYQYWVAEAKESKDRIRFYRVSGYYRHHKDALRSFVERLAKGGKFQSVAEQQEEADRLCAAISHALPGKIEYKL